MAGRTTSSDLLQGVFTCMVLIISLHAATSKGASSDPETLIKFKQSLEDKNNSLTNWNTASPPCSGHVANWVGVVCWQGNVWGLKLENMGLKGKIDVELLEKLPHLRSLSLMSNNFDGSWPEMKRLAALKALYLSNNHFSGEIPQGAFSGMLMLKKVYLAQNQFTGVIPSSLTELPRLLELRLEGNKFSGQIPDFQQKTLVDANFSNNALQGEVPAGLSKMNASSFSGNEGLCGSPLQPCKQSSGKKKPSTASVIVAAIVVGAALLAIAAVIFICCRQKKSSPNSIEAPPPHLQKASSREFSGGSRSPASSEGSGVGQKGHTRKLSFVKEEVVQFDLQDLMRASAEILGSGYFGSSYKAAMLSGPVMVVKRFKQMNNVGKAEFREHMRTLGELKHPNLLPLVAYYYDKEEKLLISEYVQKGSLAILLHGNQAQQNLDWPTRLKIVKGVGRGLLYLYNELPGLIAPHGHLKSSNVLVNDNFEPLLTDFALIPMINQEHAQELMIAYKSPEYQQLHRITKKTDVWGFGVLILEILTGKLPANFLHQGKGNEDDLANWVNSIPSEDWSTTVFDREIGLGTTGFSDNQGDMLKLLRIGLACCEKDVDKRWDLREAMERIEELKEMEAVDDDFFSSYSEAEVRSSRGLSDEMISLSLN